ncbi:MAG: 2-C-methyl-D-erythritol 4-phosphate cytidylyltransferase [Bacteroidales bacterium]|nr:2-C-methyl-D-erythritol 4-phosphate cytidylyltransferase [Bacteroidales bacterium]MDI9592494.1 2-C-methyl-D-erythritol 4-phosphate cytidylyltransferase [Bacteroidota bacterium]HOR75673.1 2-C-methyl-D-erythritol 4-phosphate cytidylyltransferase [Bacteroidales bacterium]
MNKTVIIVAGGSGKRMNYGIPKQFITLSGLPILMHTISRFYHSCKDIDIIVVLPPDHIGTWSRLCSEHSFFISHRVVKGGSQRFYSVTNGLEYIGTGELVAIHDGVRPLITKELIMHGYETASTFGSSIPVIPLPGSLRKIEGNHSYSIDRNHYCLVQTPQTFQSELIIKAYSQPYRKEFTDDASVYEAAGFQVHLIDGISENIKITLSMDLKIANVLIKDFSQ